MVQKVGAVNFLLAGLLNPKGCINSILRIFIKIGYPAGGVQVRFSGGRCVVVSADLSG